MVKSGGKLHWSTFKKVLKVHKEEHFVPADLSGAEMAPIHRLVLQLLTKGIIELRVSDKAKIGTDKLNDSHTEIGLTAELLTLDHWEGFTDVPVPLTTP